MADSRSVPQKGVRPSLFKVQMNPHEMRNKLTRNRRQGMCMMRSVRRATQFARMGWRCELQGCELWKNG
uniref:Uncharacterized protein n=1 Tax=Oryza rufipogon TaxID=4529 RepID=A0A0E0PRK8_ORYRU